VANREYELVLMLDPEIPEERRDQIAADARKRIESGGDLKHDTAWGMRKMAYEIRQRTEADYRFFRFETGVELLDELNHNLRIADGVLRFRIFKVDSDAPAIVPPAPTATPAGPPARGPRRSQSASSRQAPAPEQAAEPAPDEAPEPAAEEAAEPAAEEAAEPAADEAVDEPQAGGDEAGPPSAPSSEQKTAE
jgi:small subunit ribosomal protein S6